MQPAGSHRATVIIPATPASSQVAKRRSRPAQLDADFRFHVHQGVVPLGCLSAVDQRRSSDALDPAAFVDVPADDQRRLRPIDKGPQGFAAHVLAEAHPITGRLRYATFGRLQRPGWDPTL
jgi:hypothetical protein